jgi:hypothetical protein
MYSYVHMPRAFAVCRVLAHEDARRVIFLDLCWTMLYDDDPFIVLTETKFSIRYIPVWDRYSPLRTRVKAHALTMTLLVHW